MTQMHLFDNQTVDSFAARIAGTFDVEDEDVKHFTIDNTVVMVIVAGVGAATIKKAKNGDNERINSLKVNSMRVAEGAMRDEILDLFGFTAQAQLPLPQTAVQPSLTSQPAVTATAIPMDVPITIPADGDDEINEMFYGQTDLDDDMTDLDDDWVTHVDPLTGEVKDSTVIEEDLDDEVEPDEQVFTPAPALTPPISLRRDSALAAFLQETA